MRSLVTHRQRMCLEIPVSRAHRSNRRLVKIPLDRSGQRKMKQLKDKKYSINVDRVFVRGKM